MRTCPYCMQYFTGPANKKYCSDSCGSKMRQERWRLANPERVKELAKVRNAKHKVAMRDSHLRKTYGLDRAEFNFLMARQNNSCAICQTPIQEFAPNTLSRACVDHDHHTGKVRGILCHACNRGIGALRDSPYLIDRAISYLRNNT